MNETLQVIASRRSIRKYKPEQIAGEEMQRIMDAAIFAPSARNQQKWHFTVVQNKEIIDKMARIIQSNALNSGEGHAARFMSTPGFHVFFHAPTVVLISHITGGHFIEVDCGMAAQNILLAAEALGIGSCVIGFSRFLLISQEGIDLLRELGMPEGYSHLCAIALGYPDGTHPSMPPRNRDVINYIK
jgi:nitroreductase